MIDLIPVVPRGTSNPTPYGVNFFGTGQSPLYHGAISGHPINDQTTSWAQEYRSSISPSLPEHVGVRFLAKPYVVGSYRIIMGTNNYVRMTSWRLRGSNHAAPTVFKTLHEVTIPIPGILSEHYFEIPNTEAFDRYDIECLSRPGTNSWGIGQLSLYEKVPFKKLILEDDVGFKTYNNGWQSVL